MAKVRMAFAFFCAIIKVQKYKIKTTKIIPVRHTPACGQTHLQAGAGSQQRRYL